ncbi:MAG TPA: type II toxin-antitoxin system RelE/ParE family toxin [Candidatus Acidoferrum sp.]|jgi:proteic killer suppression protein|nr:type II toxin-antitoxin system RelE/ParE family toxin [Candidatus Acidoferrum sp.]
MGEGVLLFCALRAPEARRLESAASLKDLAALPGNRFEALLGDRKGQYSVRINDQWRICFEWPDRSPGPSNVEIVDYH